MSHTEYHTQLACCKPTSHTHPSFYTALSLSKKSRHCLKNFQDFQPHSLKTYKKLIGTKHAALEKMLHKQRNLNVLILLKVQIIAGTIVCRCFKTNLCKNIEPNAQIPNIHTYQTKTMQNENQHRYHFEPFKGRRILQRTNRL